MLALYYQWIYYVVKHPLLTQMSYLTVRNDIAKVSITVYLSLSKCREAQKLLCHLWWVRMQETGLFKSTLCFQIWQETNTVYFCLLYNVSRKSCATPSNKPLRNKNNILRATSHKIRVYVDLIVWGYERTELIYYKQNVLLTYMKYQYLTFFTINFIILHLVN